MDRRERSLISRCLPFVRQGIAIEGRTIAPKCGPTVSRIAKIVSRLASESIYLRQLRNQTTTAVTLHHGHLVREPS